MEDQMWISSYFDTYQFSSDLQQLAQSHVPHQKPHWKFLQGRPFGMGAKAPQIRQMKEHHYSLPMASGPLTNIMDHMRLHVRLHLYLPFFSLMYKRNSDTVLMPNHKRTSSEHREGAACEASFPHELLECRLRLDSASSLQAYHAHYHGCVSLLDI